MTTSQDREFTNRGYGIRQVLRYERERQELTHDALAQLSGVSAATIAGIEDGSLPLPEPAVMDSLGDALDRTPPPMLPARPREERRPTLLGVMLRRERKRLGLSLRDLADKSGVDRGTLSRIENGSLTSTGRGNLQGLATVLGLAPRVLEEWTHHSGIALSPEALHPLPTEAVAPDSPSMLDGVGPAQPFQLNGYHSALSSADQWRPSDAAPATVPTLEQLRSAARVLGKVATRHPSPEIRRQAVTLLSALVREAHAIPADVVTEEWETEYRNCGTILNAVEIVDTNESVAASARIALQEIAAQRAALSARMAKRGPTAPSLPGNPGGGETGPPNHSLPRVPVAGG